MSKMKSFSISSNTIACKLLQKLLLAVLVRMLLLDGVAGKTFTPDIIVATNETSQNFPTTRIVYDVTGLPWNYSNDPINSILSANDFNISPFLYLTLNDTAHMDLCGELKINVTEIGRDEYCKNFGVTGLAILLNCNLRLPQLTTSKTTNQTVFKIVSDNSSVINSLILSIQAVKTTFCYCTDTYALLNNYIITTFKILNKTRNSVNLGLEYDARLLGCCEKELIKFEIFKYMTSAILRLDFYPQRHLMSYGLFSEMLNDFTKDNNEFVLKYNPNCKLYIRIKMQGKYEDDVMYRYHAIMKKYLLFWMEDNPSNKELFIISTQPVSVVSPEVSETLKETVSPIILGNYSQLDKSFSIDVCTSSCNQNNMKSTINSAFKNVFMINPDWEYICSILNPCDGIKNSSKREMSLSLAFSFYQEKKYANLVKRLANNAEILNIKTMYFSNCRTNWQNAWWTSTVLTLKSKDIKIGCYLHSHSFCTRITTLNFPVQSLANIERNCGHLLNISSDVVLMLTLSQNLQDGLSYVLSEINKAIQLFEYKYPGKKLIPQIILTEGIQEKLLESSRKNGNLKEDVNDVKENSIYCDPVLQRLNEFYEAVMNHAFIYDWPKFVLGHAIDTPLSIGWWQNINVDRELNQTVTNYPVLIRTNGAMSEKRWKFPRTYPCIQWTKSAKEPEIDFIHNKFIGASINLNLRTESDLKMEEMATVLLFAFYKFSFVEILDLDEKAFKTFSKMLTSYNLLDAIKNLTKSPEVEHKLAYVEIPLSTKMNHYLGYIPNSNLVGIQFSGWEKFVKIDKNSGQYFFGLPSEVFSTNISASGTGIVVQDCIQEINLNLSQLFALPFIGSIKYLICNVRPVAPDNTDKRSMKVYLNTMFYVKTFIEAHLPTYKNNIEVIFRINLVQTDTTFCGSKYDLDKFLSFLNDFSQHSVAYKIKYFIVRGFTTEGESKNCITSWWRIKDYEDLTNASAYVDREADLFDRPTKPPLKITLPVGRDTVLENSNFVLIVSILVPIFSILFLAALTMFIVNRKLGKRLLLESEKSEFYDGVSSDFQHIDPENFKWLKMKFPKEFEISKADIKIGNVIGSGQFGVVHHGILKAHAQVAVKIQQSNCNKEKFKTILTEVKLLCYIGLHPNVVSFIGACTKQIVRGRIYIVMEYCQKGSLQGFLREKKMIQNDSKPDKVDMYQLYKFCQEIASGMEYISGKGVVHRDLATRNVLLNSQFTCKICDFGLSRRLYETTEYIKKDDELVPWRWMAPECLKTKQFTAKSDIWSYGVTAWEIFSLGSLPYSNASTNLGFGQLLEDGLRMEKAEFASDAIHTKLLACWNIFPEERPTFLDLCTFFTKLRRTEYSVI